MKTVNFMIIVIISRYLPVLSGGNKEPRLIETYREIINPISREVVSNSFKVNLFWELKCSKFLENVLIYDLLKSDYSLKLMVYF